MSDVQTEPIVDDNTPAPTEPSPSDAPKDKPVDTSWVPRRISEITAARRAAEARAAELEAENQRLRAAAQATASTDGTTAAAPANQQSVEQLAKAYAERMVNEQRAQETLNQGIARINEAGAKEYGDDFEKSVQNLQMAGVGGPDFLRVLTNIPKAEAVVTWLGKPENLNDAMRFASMDPIQMGIELTKLSTKASKDLGKQISKAPPPTTTIDGRSTGDDAVEPDPKDTKKWMEWRNKNRKTRR
jgi:hypothetical protein